MVYVIYIIFWQVRNCDLVMGVSPVGERQLVGHVGALLSISLTFDSQASRRSQIGSFGYAAFKEAVFFRKAVRPIRLRSHKDDDLDRGILSRWIFPIEIEEKHSKPSHLGWKKFRVVSSRHLYEPAVWAGTILSMGESVEIRKQ